MLRRFVKDSSIYAIAGAISQGIAFLLFPFFAHVFNPRDYGAIDILGLLGLLINLTIALEISQGLGRYIHEARDEAERALYTSTALIFTLGCLTLFTAVTLAFAPSISRAVLGRGFDPSLLRLAAVTWWTSGIFYLTQDQLRWRLRPRAYATVSIVVAAASTGSAALLVLWLHTGVYGAIGGQLAGLSCGLALTILLSRKIYARRFDWSRCRIMLRYSIPLIPASVGIFLNGYADRLALQHEGSLAQVGVYGIAFRFAVIMSLVLFGFQGAVMPLVLSNYENPDTRINLAHMFRLFCALALGATLAISVFADAGVRILAAPSYAGAAAIVPYVLAATALGGLYMFAPGPIIARRTGSITLIAASAGVLNAALAFALVPLLGIHGAAFATLVSSMLYFGALMPLSQHLYHVPHDWRRIAAAALATTALVVVSETVVPSGPQSALDPGVLLIRGALVVAGAAILAQLLIAPGERAAAWGHLRHLVAARRGLLSGTTRLL